MSLPARQERTLHDIEGILQAGEPQLASMYAIFARLNQEAPVRAEPLQPGRLRWLRPGSAISAIVLIPVMFAAVIIGALFSGSARGATSCGASVTAGAKPSLLHRTICPRTQVSPSNPDPVSTQPAVKTKTSPEGPSGTPGFPCLVMERAGPATRFTAINGDEEQGFPPSVRAGTLTTARPSGMC